MNKVIAGLVMCAALVTGAHARDTHPCTGERVPLTSEKSVVAAIECLYDARVAKVSKVNGSGNNWHYQLRILSANGRVKTIDVNPETGLPTDSVELRALGL